MGHPCVRDVHPIPTPRSPCLLKDLLLMHPSSCKKYAPGPLPTIHTHCSPIHFYGLAKLHSTAGGHRKYGSALGTWTGHFHGKGCAALGMIVQSRSWGGRYVFYQASCTLGHGWFTTVPKVKKTLEQQSKNANYLAAMLTCPMLVSHPLKEFCHEARDLS